MAEYFEKGAKCHTCYHKDACEAWVRHGKTLYDDYSFSTEGCPYYNSAADVVPVVRCQNCKHGGIVMETDDGCKYMVCKLQKFWVNPGYFCANGKERSENDV